MRDDGGEEGGRVEYVELNRPVSRARRHRGTWGGICGGIAALLGCAGSHAGLRQCSGLCSVEEPVQRSKTTIAVSVRRMWDLMRIAQSVRRSPAGGGDERRVGISAG